MKKRGLLVTGVIAGAVGLSGAAAHAAITIDPNGSAATGAGGLNASFQVSTLDWAAGNAIAEGALSAIGNGVGSEFNLLYQARLGSFTIDEDGNEPNTNLNQAGGFEWTIVAGLRERVTSTDGNSAQFELVKGPGVLNFVEIYYDANRNSNPLTGTGFSDGRLILRAEVQTIGNSGFEITGLDGGPLDQFGTNNYPGVLTVAGEGTSTPLITSVTEVDSEFFSGDFDNVDFIVDLLFQNVSQNLPFLTVNPSAAFTPTPYAGLIGTTSGDRSTTSIGVGSVGAVNGLSGPDVMFQVDTNSRFETTSNVIPEPATAGLGLMGLTALALGLRRRRQA